MAVSAFCVHLLASRVQAWKPLDPDGQGSCTSTHWENPVPHIKVVWATSAYDPNDGDPSFTAAEKGILRAVFQQFSQLPNSRVYFYEADSTEGCVGSQYYQGGNPQPVNTICVQKTDTCVNGYSGKAILGPDDGACHHASAEVRLCGNPAALSTIWATASQEVSHCLGLDHNTNSKDWMFGLYSLGAAAAHLGMTRDTMNGLNYLYPFGTNFYFGNFDVTSGGDTDILTRDNQLAGDTIPWYLTSQASFGETWSDDGQVISDHGNETTLAYVFGDFTGDGCPDAARGLCDDCDPSDGAGDTVAWNVRPSDCESGFDTSASWASDFGNGEDYDQYKTGDFDGDGCDDVWLIRNESAYNCTGNVNCAVKFWWMLARRPDGTSCASAGATPDHFSIHGTQYTLTVEDRSAATAWPWVVGDFETTNGLGCDDIAFGIGDQTNPRIMRWRILRAVDTNANGLCDSLSDDGQWAADWAALGQHHFFAANAGNGTADDIVRVGLPVSPGVQEANWSVGYSNGSDALENFHTPVTDLLVSGVEAHWTGMVFGVGNFDTINGDGVDFVTVRGASVGGAVRAQIAYRIVSSGDWTLSALGANVALPTAKAAWNQPTDEDDTATKDNGGDDAKDVWWCKTCDEWFCDTCGCCP